MLLRREPTFKSLMTAIIVLKHAIDCIAEERPAELVNRRHRGDIYRKHNSDGVFSCTEGNNLTYLVDEAQCVDQQQLLNGRVGLSKLNYLSS